ncbi:MAG: response regulator [Sedimentisphaerales bacterium]|nr:response regulator [Sedimentisphaerales bacterium]
MRNSKPVLLVEDDTIDAMTVQRAFRDLKIENGLIHVRNGEEALGYLTAADNEMPCVILLDLNMPKMNGTEFLKVVKENWTLKRIPVVVLTTSNEERDVRESFRRSVAGYIVKPVDYLKFVAAIQTIDLYWTISELPNQGQADKKAELEAATARQDNT